MSTIDNNQVTRNEDGSITVNVDTRIRISPQPWTLWLPTEEECGEDYNYLPAEVRDADGNTVFTSNCIRSGEVGDRYWGNFKFVAEAVIEKSTELQWKDKVKKRLKQNIKGCKTVLSLKHTSPSQKDRTATKKEVYEMLLYELFEEKKEVNKTPEEVVGKRYNCYNCQDTGKLIAYTIEDLGKPCPFCEKGGQNEKGDT